MNILVTGGTGFIGSHLIHKLIRLKHQIFLLKRRNSDIWRIKDISDQIKLVNIEDFKDLDGILGSLPIDMIIHLAAKYVKQEETGKDLSEILESNITFPSLLLASAIKYKVKYFINTGTCFEYEFGSKPISEKTKLKPYNFYAATKIAFEELLKYYVAKKMIKAVTLKLFYPYGEKDSPKLFYNLIDSMIKNKQIVLQDKQKSVNFTYVGDIVEAYVKTINFMVKRKSGTYQIFNIGESQSHSIESVIKLLENTCGNKIKADFTGKSDGINLVSCNNNKAKKLLNWQPKVKLKEGLTRTYRYYLLKNIK